MKTNLRILIVDDSQDDALLILRHLRKSGLDPDFERVETADGLHAAIEASQWDVVLCDVTMPRLDAVAAIETIRGANIDIPFIVVSGTVGEERLVELMKAGAHDIIVKDRLSRLVPAIEREIEEAAVRRERQQAETYLRDALESISEGFALFDADDRLIVCNETYKTFNERTRELIVPGVRFEDIVRAGVACGYYPSAEGRDEEWIAGRLKRHRGNVAPFEQRLCDGRYLLINERRTRDGGIVGIATDITRLKAAERHLRESEGFVRLIADNLPILIVYFDMEDRYRFVNRTGARWYARAPEEIVGRTAKEILGPQAYKVFREHLDRASEGTEQHFHVTVTYPDGVTRDVDAAYIPEHGADGEIRGFVAMVADVTDRMTAERALRTSEAQFRGAFETAPDGMALVGLDGRWLKVNRAVTEMLGYDEDELLGIDFQTVTHPDDLAKSLELVDRVLKGEISTYQIEKRFMRKDGEVVPVLLRVSLVRDADGQPVHFVSQLLDLTDRKEIEAQLIQAQKMEAVGQLTGGVAHDFNNLLTVIMGNARLLERRMAGGDEVTAKHLDAIVGATKRGSHLTHRLLAFSRKEKLEPASVDGRELVSGMLDMMGRTLGETIGIETRFADKPLILRADPNQLEAAILNLATNARDAMAEGGTLTIDLDTARVGPGGSGPAPRVAEGEYVVISVSDTGCGIPPEHQDRIFEPFFTSKEVGKGTGLGLSTVFGFARQSGGQIQFDTKVGEGTTFRLFLPAARWTEDRQEAAEARESTEADRRGTILVVEDEPGVRAVAVAILEDLGYRVIEAENGPDALTKLDGHGDIDLLFTDIVMPKGMTGFDLAVRARERIPDLKVLFTTGYASKSIAPEGELPPGSSIVNKPYEEAELARKVGQALASA